MKAIYIPVDGDMKVVDVENGWSALGQAIDAGFIERVRTPFPNKVLVVDESGHITGKRKNRVASVLYGEAHHGGVIVGDALLVQEGWVEDGLDFVEMDDPEGLLAGVRAAIV